MNRWILLLVLSSVSCLCVSQADDDPSSTRKRAEAQPVRLFDGFDNGSQQPWQIRNPDAEHYGYDTRPGTLTITTQKGGLYQAANNCKNVRVRLRFVSR